LSNQPIEGNVDQLKEVHKHVISGTAESDERLCRMAILFGQDYTCWRHLVVRLVGWLTVCSIVPVLTWALSASSDSVVAASTICAVVAILKCGNEFQKRDNALLAIEKNRYHLERTQA
jgi:hypothetical protein